MDHARPERLGELVRALLPTHPELDVYSEARGLAEVKPDSTVVLVPRAEDVDWLNINRPLFALNRLRVVLYSSREVSVALARGAVDFFDWISHRLECPPGPAPFAVAGLRRALARRAPGVVWKGGDLEAAFRVARPRRRLRTISAARPYEELVEEARTGGGDWLAWTEVEGVFRLRRVRWALAEARRRARTILVEPAVLSPGWWEVHGLTAEFSAAYERLAQAGARHAGRLAALVDLEPEAIERMRALLEQGTPEQSLAAELARSAWTGTAGERLVATDARVEARLWKALRGAETWEQLAIAARRAGDFQVAHLWARRAWELEPERWTVLAQVLADLGRWAEAEALFRQRPTGAARRKLAGVLERQGRYVEAEQLLRQEMAMNGPVLDAEGIASLHGLASVLERQGQYAEAEQLLRQGLALREEALGTAHPKYAASLHGLAGVLERRGYYVEAEALLRRGLAIYLRAFGEEHPHYTASLHELARVLERQGRYAEAEALLRQVLATKHGLGEHHPEYATSLHALARVLQGQGRYAEAETLLRQGLAIEAEILGEKHPVYATSLHELGRVLERQGRYAEAEQLLRQGLALEERALGKAHPDYAASLRELARVLERQGRYTEAEQLLRQALSIGEAALGTTHPDLCSVLTLLGLMLARQDRPQEGEPFHQRSAEIALLAWGLPHPVTAQALHHLALTQVALKKTEAVATARQAREAFLESLGPEHPLTREALPELNLIAGGHSSEPGAGGGREDADPLA